MTKVHENANEFIDKIEDFSERHKGFENFQLLKLIYFIFLDGFEINQIIMEYLMLLDCKIILFFFAESVQNLKINPIS